VKLGIALAAAKWSVPAQCRSDQDDARTVKSVVCRNIPGG
jgi:hypothetical protein